MGKTGIDGTLKSITPSGNRKIIFSCTAIRITADMKGPFILQTATRRFLCGHIFSLTSKGL